ncbi:hypothetical protein PFNF135_01469 [Plasmodium falciparum NF135/5.C10]|nr:hypothetical protein PFNF135_01469 [Plasmodium falciparum NF135/5.C10]
MAGNNFVVGLLRNENHSKDHEIPNNLGNMNNYSEYVKNNYSVVNDPKVLNANNKENTNSPYNNTSHDRVNNNNNNNKYNNNYNKTIDHASSNNNIASSSCVNLKNLININKNFNVLMNNINVDQSSLNMNAQSNNMYDSYGKENIGIINNMENQEQLENNKV